MWKWMALIALPLFWVLVDTAAGFRALRYRKRASLWSKEEVAPVNDFSILVPIYGNTKYLTNIGYLEYYSKKVILCTTSGETEEFYQNLEKIASRYGFRIYRSPYIPVTTTKRRRTGGTIRDRVIRDALIHVSHLGAYTICMDADTTTPEPLEKLVGALASSKADFASINLIPQEKGGILVQLQRHEYRQSMRMCFILPWKLSGACHVGRTTVLRAIMTRHSLFFQGNDVETGVIGEQLGYKAICIPFAVNTDVPSRFIPWWRQRIAWAGGEFRLFIMNIRFITVHPFLWIYGSFITILMVGLRWWALLEPSWILLDIALLYYISIVVIHWETRNWWLLLLPIYALFSSLIVTVVGAIWYFVMAIPERNFGIIRPRRKELVA